MSRLYIVSNSMRCGEIHVFYGGIWEILNGGTIAGGFPAGFEEMTRLIPDHDWTVELVPVKMPCWFLREKLLTMEISRLDTY